MANTTVGCALSLNSRPRFRRRSLGLGLNPRRVFAHHRMFASSGVFALLNALKTRRVFARQIRRLHRARRPRSALNLHLSLNSRPRFRRRNRLSSRCRLRLFVRLASLLFYPLGRPPLVRRARLFKTMRRNGHAFGLWRNVFNALRVFFSARNEHLLGLAAIERFFGSSDVYADSAYQKRHPKNEPAIRNCNGSRLTCASSISAQNQRQQNLHRANCLRNKSRNNKASYIACHQKWNISKIKRKAHANKARTVKCVQQNHAP